MVGSSKTRNKKTKNLFERRRVDSLIILLTFYSKNIQNKVKIFEHH